MQKHNEYIHVDYTTVLLFKQKYTDSDIKKMLNGIFHIRSWQYSGLYQLRTFSSLKKMQHKKI